MEFLLARCEPPPVLKPRLVHMASLSAPGGIPLALVLITIPAWLADQGVSPSEIGLLSAAGLPWSFKFLWSPLLDRWPPPFGGRRRGWMIIAQAGLLLTIALLSQIDPHALPWVIALTAAI